MYDNIPHVCCILIQRHGFYKAFDNAGNLNSSIQICYLVKLEMDVEVTGQSGWWRRLHSEMHYKHVCTDLL